jgi:DNA-binding response OmpR family regulator
MVIEQQSPQLRVVSGGNGVKSQSSRKTSQRYPLAQAPRRAILYIGGDQDCRVILSRIVRRMDNAQLVVADSGREGRLSAFARTPNLILVDSEVSDCDPHTLLVSFGRTALGVTVPVAVLSPDDNERLRFMQAGAVAWMTKPLRIADVERSMSRLLDLYTAR